MMNGKKGKWMVKENMNRWPTKTGLKNAIHCLSNSQQQKKPTMNEWGIQRVEKTSQSHVQLHGSAELKPFCDHDFNICDILKMQVLKKLNGCRLPNFFWTFGRLEMKAFHVIVLGGYALP